MMQAFTHLWMDLSKGTWTSTRKWIDAQSDLTANLAQQHIDMVGIFLENGTKQIQTLAQAKRLDDVLTTQSELLTELNKKILNNLRVSFEILVDAHKQLTH